MAQGPSYTLEMDQVINETSTGGAGGGGRGSESSGPNVEQVINETGATAAAAGGAGSESSGPSDITLDMEHVINETGATAEAGGGGGGSESSGPSDITLDMEHVVNETGATATGGAGGGIDSSGTGANTKIMIIPKVRKQLRVIDENSYTPHHVPIGPYHVKYSSSEIAEEKLQYVHCLESRLSEQQRAGGGLTDLLAEELEPLVRACYPRIGHMTTTEQWSTIKLLHDGCFLLCCMMDYNDTPHVMPALSNNNVQVASTPAVNDQESVGVPNSSQIKWGWIKSCFSAVANSIGGTTDQGTPPASSNNATGNDRLTRSCDNNTVVRDTVFLLDNQIPFFVLQRIHELVKGDTMASSVLEPIADYIQELLQEQLYISKHRRLAPTTPPSHLLHLVHFYMLPRYQVAKQENAKRPRTGRWLRATEYCRYGNVSFKPRVFKDGEGWSFLDVHLQGGTLWIPRLQVDDMTCTILRNLMALEEQPTTHQKPVTAYCVFMSQVAGTVQDVELLQRQGVLEQFLVNNEEVAQGFANLCRGVVLDIDNDDRNYLKPIWHELSSLCTYPRYCCGSFRQKKCSDPIYIAGFVVGIFFFLFGLAQVILPLPKVQKHL